MRLSVLLIAAVLAASLLFGDDKGGSWSATAGLKYSSGDYGTAYTTEITELPLTVNYRHGGWSFGATFSYLYLESDGNVTMTPGGVVGADVRALAIGKGAVKSSTVSTSESGMGDILVQGGYRFAFEELPALKVGGIVKIATADPDKGLGTGEHDLSLQAGIFDTYGKLALSANGGYKITGDPDTITYNDIFYGSLGSSYLIMPSWSLGAGYYYAQPIADGLAAQSSVSLYSSHRLSKAALLGVSYIHGLTDATADHVFSALLSLYF